MMIEVNLPNILMALDQYDEPLEDSDGNRLDYAVGLDFRVEIMGRSYNFSPNQWFIILEGAANRQAERPRKILREYGFSRENSTDFYWCFVKHLVKSWKNFSRVETKKARRNNRNCP